MTRDTEASDSTRQTLLKTLAAAGVVGAGATAASSSAAARGSGQGQGRGPDRMTFDIERDGEIVEETDAVSRFDVGDDVTFDGELILKAIWVEDEDFLASGRVRGILSSNPTKQVNKTFEGINLGGLPEGALDVLSLDEAGECPILELVVELIFLNLLGLQLETETIEIDLIVVAGEGKLLGNLLCAVAGLLNP